MQTRIQLTLLLAALAAGCGGSSTPQRDPLAPPPPAPNADVGQERAAQDAALATRERTTTQERTDAVAEKPR
jgi:hypothetical protein